MSQLRDALRSALPVKAAPEAPTLVAREPAPSAAPAGPKLPDPLASDWVALMRSLGAEVPKDPSMGQLTQRSDLRSKELAAQGRKRDADELKRAKESFLREREKAAWSLVKARFDELELSEKAYRAIKQEGADPEKVLPRLNGRRGDELRGAGAARVRDALLGA